MAQGELTDADVFGTASGEPLTPEQQAYAYHMATARDPSAPGGSIMNPSYVTPEHPATGAGYEVAPTGHVDIPQASGALTDDDVFGPGAGAAQAGPKSQVMGLEKGLALPFAHAWDVVGRHPFLKQTADALDAAWPEFSAIRDLTGRLSKIGMADVSKREALGQQPGKLGEFAGNVADTILLPGGPLTAGALSGAMLSNSDDLGGMAKDAVIGGLGGKLAHGVLGSIGGVVAPKVSPSVRTLLDADIPLTVGQIKGGALRRVEDGMSSFPIVGDVVKNAKLRGVEGLNAAVANRALAPIGESLPADIAPGRDAIAYAGDKLSDSYNALIPHLNLTADPQLSSDIAAIGKSAATTLHPEYGKLLKNMIGDNIVRAIDPATGAMDGQALKDAESTLGGEIGLYSKSNVPADRKYADALKMTRQVLRDWVTRANPAAADELSRLNNGWANLAIGEDAASRLGAHDGLFTPGQLAGAVRSANDSVRKRGYARGEALMQDLSDAALAHLPSTVPDSGSPFRHALEAGVAGLVGKEAGLGPAMGKASAIGAILSAPYTRAGQPIAQSLLAGARPNYSPAVAALLAKLQPAARASGSIAGVRALGPPSP